jgi:hypothetical protein
VLLTVRSTSSASPCTELAPVRGRERVEGEGVGLGVLEHARDLAEPAVEMRDRFGEPVARLGERVGVEDRPDQRREQPVLIAARVAQAVTQEVNGAALPSAAQDPCDRGLQAGRERRRSRAARRQAALDEPSERGCPVLCV